MDRVHFVLVVPGLVEDPRGSGQQAGKRFVGNRAFSVDVADDPPQEDAQFSGLLSCSFKLAGMGVAALLDESGFPHALVVLTQLDVPLFGRPHQRAAGLVVEPGIGGEGHRFFLNRRIDVHPFHMAFGQQLAPFAVPKVWTSIFSSLSGPRRLHQRTREEGSNGISC